MDTPSIIIIVFCVLLLAFVVYVLLRGIFGLRKRPKEIDLSIESVTDDSSPRRVSSYANQFNTVHNQDIDELNGTAPLRRTSPSPSAMKTDSLGSTYANFYANSYLHLAFNFEKPFLHFGKWTAIPDNQREEVTRLMAQNSNHSDVQASVQANELKVCFYTFADSGNLVVSVIRQPKDATVASEAQYCEITSAELVNSYALLGAKNSSSVVGSVNFLDNQRPCVKSQLTDADGETVYQWQIPLFTEKYIYIVSVISKGYANNYIPEMLKLFSKW